MLCRLKWQQKKYQLILISQKHINKKYKKTVLEKQSEPLSEQAHDSLVQQVRIKEYQHDIEERAKQIRHEYELDSKARAEQEVRKEEEIFRNFIEAIQNRNHLEQKKLEKQIAELEQKLSVQKAESARREKDLQEELAHYKELKAKSSTKMIGETLEQHCELSFEMIALLRDMAKTKAVYQKQVQELRSKESDKEEIRKKVLLEKKTLDKALSGIQSNTADSLKAIDTVIAKLQKIRTMVAQTESNTVTALSVSEQIAEVIH